MIKYILTTVLLSILSLVGYVLRTSGKNSVKLNQALKELDEIHKANIARRSVKPTDSLRDDKYNRDNIM